MVETPNEYVERAERAEHAAELGGLHQSIIPLSIAVMAVIAVVFETMETTAATTAAIARSDAAIRQNEATDLWGEYQAESLKKHIYAAAASQPGADAAQLNSLADKYAALEPPLQEQAQAKEKETAAQVATSEAAMERHHRLTYSTNIIHLAIALASISLVMRRRAVWIGALVVTAAGIAVGLT